MKCIKGNLGRRAKNILGITISFIIIINIILLASGCACEPILTNLDPASGPPGTVVQVRGSNLPFAGVRWDANTASEQSLPSSFLSARFFTVPLSASIGSHPVRLFGDGVYSNNTVNFNVTAETIRPQPRLDDATVCLFNISGNKASMILMAHNCLRTSRSLGYQPRSYALSYSYSLGHLAK